MASSSSERAVVAVSYAGEDGGLFTPETTSGSSVSPSNHFPVKKKSLKQSLRSRKLHREHVPDEAIQLLSDTDDSGPAPLYESTSLTESDEGERQERKRKERRHQGRMQRGGRSTHGLADQGHSGLPIESPVFVKRKPPGDTLHKGRPLEQKLLKGAREGENIVVVGVREQAGRMHGKVEQGIGVQGARGITQDGRPGAGGQGVQDGRLRDRGQRAGIHGPPGGLQDGQQAAAPGGLLGVGQGGEGQGAPQEQPAGEPPGLEDEDGEQVEDQMARVQDAEEDRVEEQHNDLPNARAYQSCVAKLANNHWRCCCGIISVIVILLLALMAGTVALGIYYLVETLRDNTIQSSPILPSTNEVYSLNHFTDHHNTSIFTSKVCIDKINKAVSNSVVHLEHGKCTGISKEEKERTIDHSFSDTTKPKPLNFFWMENSTFRFNLTLVTNSSMTFTIYVFQQSDFEEQRDECIKPPKTYIAKLIFPNSTNSTHNVACTHEEDKYTCKNHEHIKIHHSGRYRICIFVNQDEPFFVNYTLRVHEIRYATTSKFPTKHCHLDKKQCCISYSDDPFEELLHPSCTLIKTKPPEEDKDLAYSLPELISIETHKNWEGLLYLLAIFVFLFVLLLIVLCLCGYTCYRRKHPQGYCCII